jgi:hypothetical protein
MTVPPRDPAPFAAARHMGRLQEERLVECSGMDVSLTTDDLLWAINDGGHGPFLYALAGDGRSRGRVTVAGAQNRDWEGLETFMWQGRSMILIADFGDNQQRHPTHNLYIVNEPRLDDAAFAASAVTRVAWRIVFSYPDRPHDAEGVAVDTRRQTVLVLTKRDDPPLLFELPLAPQDNGQPLTARFVTTVGRIPAPTADDRLQPFGRFRSQPTALDLSPDGRHAVVLTYKHAYLFDRNDQTSWETAFDQPPLLIPLPLPQDRSDLRQREAICFTPDGKALWVTSEGKGAGLFRLKAE